MAEKGEVSRYWQKAARGHVVFGYKGVDVQDMSVETYLVNGVLRASVEGKVVGGGPKDGQLTV